MSLPLPNLDSRRWDDLVAEAVARLPRLAPEWTDYNASDPGITLVELLAYTTEQSLYRANRVTARLLRAFLRLSGPEAEPRGPRPARLPLAFRVDGEPLADPLHLPAGLVLLPEPALAADAVPGGSRTAETEDPFAAPVRLIEPLDIRSFEIRSIQTTDGRGGYNDLTRPGRGATSFAAWGEDPSVPELPEQGVGPSLVLGLSPDPVGDSDTDVRFSIRVDLNRTVADRGECLADSGERLRAELERRARAAIELRLNSRTTARPKCQSKPIVQPRAWTGLPEEDAGLPDGDLPPSRVAWESYDRKNRRWVPMKVPRDRTRGLTLDGTIDLEIPGSSRPSYFIKDSGFAALGDRPVCYIRCRLVEGRPDTPPRIARLEVNAALVEQTMPALSTLPTAAGPSLWEGTGGLTLQRAAALMLGVADVPPFETDADRRRAAQWVQVGRGRDDAWTIAAGLLGPTAPDPDGTTRVVLDVPAVVPGSLQIATVEPSGSRPDAYRLRAWEAEDGPDLTSASGARFVFDTPSRELRFGDGRRGLALPRGSFVLATYAATGAASGTPPVRRRFFLPGLSEPRSRPLTRAEIDRIRPLAEWNRILWGSVPGGGEAIQRLHARSGDRLPGDIARAGADPEPLDDALARLVRSTRAASNVAARAASNGGTLDGLDALAMRSLVPPGQAIVGADFERLALETPGATVRRARAFEGVDPAHPGLPSPGRVTLAILPDLPRDRPEPSPGLIRRVESYLRGRRSIGTHPRVVGPAYVPIGLRAVLTIAPGARAQEVEDRARAALRNWTHPLTRRSGRAGWPFGDMPTVAEVLALMASVPGVADAADVYLDVPRGPRVPWALPWWHAVDFRLVSNG